MPGDRHRQYQIILTMNGPLDHVELQGGN
ncbi:MAG: hypothetical protein ACLTDR_01045 [Adlercreutzia equolifaciens]